MRGMNRFPALRSRRGRGLLYGVIATALPAALLAAAPARAAAPAPYTIVDLGALSAADTSVATAVNNSGAVVGYSTSAAGLPTAVRWSGGTVTALGTLPGGSDSYASAINDSGQIAGTANRPPMWYGYPVRWNAAGAISDLSGTVDNRLGVGNGIDPAGRVAGGQRPANSEGGPDAILYDVSGHPTELGDPPESIGAANAVNAVGQVVGGSPAFVWRSGVTTLLPGLPGGAGATATAVGISGRIVGSATAAGSSVQRAVEWNAGAVTDLGTVGGIEGSRANGVNAAGQIVGTADPQCSPCQAPKAWIRQPGGTATALDTLLPAGSGWTLRQANGINDRGQIVGAGLHNGALHAYLLTPAFHANVNFGPAGAAVPAGYTPDTGLSYGARSGGPSFGWNIDNTTNGRDRGATSSPDQRYDTLIHMQRTGSATVWELAVPDGSYLVHVVVGDPGNTDSVYKVDAEGVRAVSGTPGAAAHWFEGTVRVAVSDGRLTLTNSAGSANDKLDWIDVVSV